MSIYHLHIPRTSGVFIREFAVKKLNKLIFAGHTQKLPSSFSDYDIVSGHFATTPIKDTDINFSIFRNPVDLTFSYINYIRDKFYQETSLEDLIEQYLSNEKIYSFVNINSKFLTGKIDIYKYNKNITNLLEMAENCWFVKNYDTEAKDIIKTIQKNKTILVDFESDHKYATIGQILGISIGGNKVNESSVIDQDVINKYYDLITFLNKTDLEVYGYAKEQA